MIVISQSVVLGALVQADLNSPVFGWHNIVSESTIAADVEQPGYPATNLATVNTWQMWRAATAADVTFLVDSDGLVELDYVALAKHNLGSGQYTVTVYTTLGVGWTQVAQFIPATNSPILVRFPKGLYSQIRVDITSGSQAPYIAVMYVGELLVSERRIYVGHSPITLNRRSDILSGRSEAGNFLGRVVLQERNQTAVALNNLTPLWYREKFQPYVLAAIDQPFFFAWRPLSYPEEVGYAWLTDDPSPTNQSPNGMMQVGLNMTGII